MRRKLSPMIIAGLVVLVAAVVVAVVWWSGSDASKEDPAASPTSAAPSGPVATPSEPAPTETTRPPRPVTPEPVEDEPALDDPAELADGATATVTKIERLRSEANLPGEVSAPALRFTIEATAGDEPLALSAVVVNAYFGPDRTPAIEMGAPGAKPFGGTLAPGKSATGVYVFNVPRDERDEVRLEFSWSADEDPVILTGKVS